MTREQKIEKRKARALARRGKKCQKYFDKIRAVSEFSGYIPLSCANRYGVYGSWEDRNSPTGYSQVCDYYGICQSPCNGDC